MNKSKPMQPAAMMDQHPVLSAARVWYPVPVYQAVYRGTDSSGT